MSPHRVSPPPHRAKLAWRAVRELAGQSRLWAAKRLVALERAPRRVSSVIAQMRPASYDKLAFEQQRVIDTILWTAAMLLVCVSFTAVLLLYFQKALGSILMLFGLLQVVAAAFVVKRGYVTAAVVLLTAWMLLMLDLLTLGSGGAQSTTTIWYVIVPSAMMMMLPARHRFIALLALVAHQVALSFAMYANITSLAVHLNGAGVPINYLMSISIAGGFGLAIAAARERMVQRLGRAQNDLRLAMTHLLSGFFVIDRQGRLVVDTSETLQRWLGGGREGDDVYECLKNRRPWLAERFRVGFDALVAGNLSSERCVALLPVLLPVGQRHFQLQYNLWHEEGEEQWSRICLTVRDVTAEIRSEEDARHRQALAVFVRGLQRDPEDVTRRVAEIDSLVNQLRQHSGSANWDAWAHDLVERVHALELPALARALQAATLMTLGKDRQTGALEVATAWDKVREVFQRLHDERGTSTVRASRHQHEALRTLIRERATRPQLLSQVASWTGESTAAAIGKADGLRGDAA